MIQHNHIQTFSPKAGHTIGRIYRYLVRVALHGKLIAINYFSVRAPPENPMVCIQVIMVLFIHES